MKGLLQDVARVEGKQLSFFLFLFSFLFLSFSSFFFKSVVVKIILEKEDNSFFSFSVAPEFERGSCRTPLVSTDDSILNQDPVWKASREYIQLLKKNYMI